MPQLVRKQCDEGGALSSPPQPSLSTSPRRFFCHCACLRTLPLLMLMQASSRYRRAHHFAFMFEAHALPPSPSLPNRFSYAIAYQPPQILLKSKRVCRCWSYPYSSALHPSPLAIFTPRRTCCLSRRKPKRPSLSTSSPRDSP